MLSLRCSERARFDRLFTAYAADMVGIVEMRYAQMAIRDRCDRHRIFLSR